MRSHGRLAAVLVDHVLPPHQTQGRVRPGRLRHQDIVLNFNRSVFCIWYILRPTVLILKVETVKKDGQENLHKVS